MAILKQPTPVSLFLIFFRLSMAIAKHLSRVSPFLIFCHHFMATAKNLTPVLPFLIFCRHFMAIVKQLTPFPPLIPSVAISMATAKHLTPVSPFLTFCHHTQVIRSTFIPSLASDLLSPFHGNCQTNPSLAFPDLLSPFNGRCQTFNPVPPFMAIAEYLFTASLFLIFCRLSTAIVKQLTPVSPFPDLLFHFHWRCQNKVFWTIYACASRTVAVSGVAAGAKLQADELWSIHGHPRLSTLPCGVRNW